MAIFNSYVKLPEGMLMIVDLFLPATKKSCSLEIRDPISLPSYCEAHAAASIDVAPATPRTPVTVRIEVEMDDGKNSIGSNDMLDISGYVYTYIYIS